MLRVETSALSRTVRQLEDELEVPLFERHPRGVRTTAAGSEFLSEARAILQSVARAQERARRAGRGLHGRLTIGHVWSFERGAAARLILAYRSAHPEVELRLVEGGAVDLASRLGRLELDILLTAATDAERTILGGLTNARVLPLWSERLYVVVPASEAREHLRWADLEGRKLVRRQTDAAPEFARVVAKRGGPRLSFELHDCSYAGLLALVAAEVGWALLPESLAHSGSGIIRFVPLASGEALLRVVAAWLETTENPALTRFVALAKELQKGGT